MSKKIGSKKKRIFLRIMIPVVLAGICGAFFLAAYTLCLSEWKDFDPSELADMDDDLLIFDKDGKEYACLDGGENRRVIDASSLPAHVSRAFLAIEDNRFYEHNGIDLVRIAGAVVNDIKSGSFKEGASTISQQLVRASKLTSDKTVRRKLTEIMMAFCTERAYTKDEILSLYLNRVYFGNGAYGIEAAAQSYFGVHARELSVSQSATLAGILKSPTLYSPVLNPARSLERRNLVLAKMKECGYLTDEQYSSALAEKLCAHRAVKSYPHGYFTDEVLFEACDVLGVSMQELLSGGYKIYTSLDTSLQSYAEDLMADDALFPAAAEDGAKPEAALIVLDSKTSLLRALIGGRRHTARLGFSRATDMRRQPGSAIKPVLVFAPALEYRGYTATSFLLDQPIKFADYSPRNSGSAFHGWMTLRDVVAYSVNIPAVSILEDVGVGQAKAYAKSVGIRFSPKDQNLSLALGGFTDGVTPLELAGAYQPFSNGGYFSTPTAICRILDADGKELYSSKSKGRCSVLSAENAFIMTSMLTSAVEYGTAKKLKCAGIPLAAKTGTTTYDDAVNNKDAWITAFNSAYVVTTWMGFDNSGAVHSLKKGETGGAFPALLTKKIFEHIYKGVPAPSFAVPEGIRAVSLDSQALKETFEAVPAMAGSENSITEYYTKDTAPAAFENDSRKEAASAFTYYDVTG